MKKCENCQLFRQLRYKGGEKWYNYCYREGYLNPCSGGKCDFPKYFKPINEQKNKNECVPKNQKRMCTQKPIMNDFEKEWQNYFKDKGDVATVNIKSLAKHFVKWQKERTIDEACEWLKYKLDYCEIECYDEKKFINDFKEAMKGGEE